MTIPNKKHDRLNALVKYLSELPDEKFMMESFFDACGTPQCIAGHAAALFDINGGKMLLARDESGSETRLPDTIGMVRLVSDELGIGRRQGARLFTPSWEVIPWDIITREHAIDALRQVIMGMVETESIWKRAISDYERAGELIGCSEFNP